MSGRFYLTVAYDEPNPHYVEPPMSFDPYGDHPRDRRTPEQQQPRTSRTVLACELTSEQWQELKQQTLRVWDPRQQGDVRELDDLLRDKR